MVRRHSSEYEWAKMLYEKCMLDRDDADHYSSKLVRHDLSIQDLPEITQNVLREVGISRMGHVLAILKYGKEMARQQDRTSRRRGRSYSRSRSRSESRSSYESDSRSRSRSPRHRSHSPRDRYHHRRSESRSPQRSRAKSPREETYRKRSAVAHIDRTQNKSKKSAIDDDQLLTTNIELPARFRSKTKQPSVLQSAGSFGGPKIKRTFTENPDLAQRLGIEKNSRPRENQNQMDTDQSGYVYVKQTKTRKFSVGEDGILNVGLPPKLQKFKRAERPEEPSVFDRIKQGARYRTSGREPSNNLETTQKSDKNLANINHKEGRFGRSAGIFSMDDDRPRSPRQSSSSQYDKPRSSLKSRLGSINSGDRRR